MKGSREAISVAMRFHIMRRDNYTCQYCGAKAPDTALHVDHVVPVVEGGTNDPANLLAACVRCNIGKGTMAAKSDDARPLTAREATLARRAEWWQASEHRSLWALSAAVGDCPISRSLLMMLAAESDPYGMIVLSFGVAAARLHFPEGNIRVAARGLVAVGYLNLGEENAELQECEGQLNFVPLSQDGHTLRPAMSRGLPDFFATVGQIHG